MDTPDPVNLALIGCGRIAARHARTLRAFEGVRFWFASRSAERAEDFSRRLGGSGSFGSYEAAFASPAIEIALVATPPDAHLAATLDALAHGKHVIVEKPAFLRSAETDLVAEAATRAKRRVFVAENYRYKPLLRTLRRLLENDVVGELRLVEIDAMKWQRAPEWMHGEGGGMGALFEGGIHWIHLLASLGPEVESVRGHRHGSGSGAERGMTVVVGLAGGAVGTLHHSWETPSLLRGLRMSHVYGTRGAIGFESNGLFVRTSGTRSRLIVPGLADITGHRAMFDDFLTAVRDGHEPEMTLALARRDLEIVEEAYRTAAESSGPGFGSRSSVVARFARRTDA